MTTSPLRVLHVVDSLSGGGVAALELTFAEAVLHRPVQLTVVALYPPFPGVPTNATQLRPLGVVVHQLDVPNAGLRRRLIPLVELTRIVRSVRPQVIRTALSSGNTLGALVGSLTGTPVVATLHATIDETQRHSRRARALETAALRWGAARVVAVGQVVADSHRGRLHREVTVVPNAVPVPRPLPQSARARLRAEVTGDADRPLLLSVGRLVPQKGLPDLVAAFAEVRRRHPGAVLALAGPGPLGPEVQARARALGVEADVLLLGNRTDVDQLLCAADLFVTASWWEGLPLAVLEAMAAGLPVVATSVGENPRLLGEGRGRLVPPRAPRQLADAVCALLADPADAARRAAAAAAYVADVHGVKRWADELLDIYAQVAGAERALVTGRS